MKAMGRKTEDGRRKTEANYRQFPSVFRLPSDILQALSLKAKQ